MTEAFLEPGVLVRHPTEPGWGVGQVQSIDDHRVTVTFEEAGKRVIDVRHVMLDYLGPDPRADGRGV
jgi:transcription elongation factor GreA-like protein